MKYSLIQRIREYFMPDPVPVTLLGLEDIIPEDEKYILKCLENYIYDILKTPVKKAGIASLYEGIWYDIDITPDSLAKYRQELLNLYKRISASLDSGDFPAEGNCELCGYKGKICKGFLGIPSNKRTNIDH